MDCFELVCCICLVVSKFATSVLALYRLDCAKSLQMDSAAFSSLHSGCTTFSFSFLRLMINEAPRSGVFIWCRLWSGYQLGGEVINYPTLSIKRRGYQLSHVINYPQDDLSSEPIMENRPNHVLAKPTLHPPHPFIYHLLYIHLLVDFPEQVVGAFRVIIIWRWKMSRFLSRIRNSA